MRSHGYTLIELLVVLLVVGILVGLATSGLRLGAKTNLEAKAHLLFHDLQYARTEAIKRQKAVFVCPTLTTKSCHKGPASGYMIFLKPTHPLEPIEILKVNTLGLTELTLNAALNFEALTFNPNGTCQTAGSFYLSCDDKVIRLAYVATGRVRMVEEKKQELI